MECVGSAQKSESNRKNLACLKADCQHRLKSGDDISFNTSYFLFFFHSSSLPQEALQHIHSTSTCLLLPCFGQCSGRDLHHHQHIHRHLFLLPHFPIYRHWSHMDTTCSTRRNAIHSSISNNSNIQQYNRLQYGEQQWNRDYYDVGLLHVLLESKSTSRLTKCKTPRACKSWHHSPLNSCNSSWQSITPALHSPYMKWEVKTAFRLLRLLRSSNQEKEQHASKQKENKGNTQVQPTPHQWTSNLSFSQSVSRMKD